MPKSKRQHLVHLSKTQPKGRPEKEKLFANVRACVGTYSSIYIYSVQNMRNQFLKIMREEWKGKGRFFYGRGRVMAKALGTTEEEEVETGLHQISQVSCYTF